MLPKIGHFRVKVKKKACSLLILCYFFKWKHCFVPFPVSSAVTLKGLSVAQCVQLV